MKTYWKAISMFVGVTLLAGCAGAADGSFNDPNGEAPFGDGPLVPLPQNPVPTVPGESSLPQDPTDPDPTDPGPAGKCEPGRVYTGFGGRVMVSRRADELAALDRRRVKPYSALTGEYQRVLGTTPSQLNGAGTTFGESPARWNEEPGFTAITLFTAYRIAFQGCLTLTANDGAYANAPSAAAATDVCGTWARKFWSRDATQQELDTCVKHAVDETTVETNPRRRWAYTCATMLTTSGFLSY